MLAIDENEVYRLAKVGCSNSEIADYYGCAHTTIERRFAHVLTKARATLKRRLRRKQLELALKGDKVMLIWLGKQMLGQSDSPAVLIQNNIEARAVIEQQTRAEEVRFIKISRATCLRGQRKTQPSLNSSTGSVRR